MVVKMMKWRPWPSISSKKVEAQITIHQIKGLTISSELQDSARFAVEIKWKGSKGNALRTLRKSVRRNFTKEKTLREDGVVEWNEKFQNLCNLLAYKEGLLIPWEVSFTVFNGSKHGPNGKIPIIATGTLNLAHFVSHVENQDREVTIPLDMPGASIHNMPSLCLSIFLLELRNAEEPSGMMLRPVLSFPLSPCYGEISPTEKEENSVLKASLKRVNIFRGLSRRRAKKTGNEEEGSDERSSVRSEEIYPLDTDSLDDSEEVDFEEVKEDSGGRKSFSYGTLAYVNHAGTTSYMNTSGSEDQDWVYYSHRKSDVGKMSEQSIQPTSKRRVLPWRKRKLSFRSPKVKGEPLLKNHYGEEGGDDIDFDRRQLSSSDESTFGKTEEDSVSNKLSACLFGDDNFAVGNWEQKEIISRDGHMKLQTQVFFASIDQRSERAAGESACTALVAVIADWLQSDADEMPIKSQLDSLIREGSLEWRNLCENEIYRERFPDKHFDLETVLQAKVRPISVAPEKSFIGFFHPEGLENGDFDFLHGAMSFDNIWDEICRTATDCSPTSDRLIYIISWNDHFFILKVEQDAYYIIDTLGERLYEGCNQAFILKFDRHTTIHQLANIKTKKSDNTHVSDEQNEAKEGTSKGQMVISSTNVQGNSEEEHKIVCMGKESCKEYIKSFLAAIPLRELQVDLKKGLMASTPLHQRLQIEFHYTRHLQPVMETSAVDAISDIQEIQSMEVPDELES
ncbi:unnamed protein product [Fraxinus pennsylvanica]|uniref:C2 NT-type domain-containing protein n=1 Tax=Fraxinus pennsylvanica TaxID=56036 RepID=A0AAD1Z242_9LAMI|nr:unnamed protein product [Fraxinus pennsylvanica]